VEEEILYSHAHVDSQLARNICGAMMFEGDAALKKIGVISGGEKSRVMLGKILVTPVNLLLLDEPTNHLDMESCDALLAAIDSFDGAVVMVTHNEMFLHALAERLIVFQNDRVSVFEGSYQRFLEKGGWQDDELPAKPVQENASEAETGKKPSRKDMRRRRSEIIIERGKVLKPLEQSIKRVESDIETYEEKLSLCSAAMQEATQANDGPRIKELSQSIHNFRSKIDRLFDELEQLTNRFEKEQALFDKRMEELE
jgi:ATP-binding cassette subfamily F protein 3